MMTHQEIFDKVAAHLIKQGRQSALGGGCVYRGPDNTSCAIGCLIPDSAYDPLFDADDGSVLHQVGNPAFVAALAAGGVELTDDTVLDLLDALQGLHDDTDHLSWHWRLQTLASGWGLEFKP
jgi:hypothetical protein